MALPRVSRRRFLLLTFCAWVVLMTLRLATFPAPLPPTQRLELELPATFAPGTEPLIVVGKPDLAELLYVRYQPDGRIAIGHDRWGGGGEVSAPLTVAGGQRLTLEITLPALSQVIGYRESFAGGSGRMEVKVDGRLVLSRAVAPLPHAARAVWFGRNPIGGTPGRDAFSGRMFDARGAVVLPGGRPSLGPGQRLEAWRPAAAGESAALVLVAAGLAALLGWVRRGSARTVLAMGRRHAPFLAAAAVSTGWFAALLTSGTRDLVYPDTFGDFYDYQARSLLQGRLDVPERGINLEAFIHEGRYYGYFGPTPALLRLPCLLFDVGFGQLTRPSMIAAWLVALAGAYRLLGAARTLLGAPGRGWTTALFILGTGLGSTLLFLGSRAYVYHEAILWGAAFGIWALYAVVRYALAPTSGWWVGALALGMLSLHARPPTGLHALCGLGCVALLALWRGDGSRARSFGIGVAALLGIVSFNALSYAKFDTWEGCPLRLNVQYNAKRLAVVDGKQFHLVNLPFNTATYFTSPNLFIQPRFPWLLLNVSKPGPEHRSARIDYTEKTLAVPYAMTSLSLMAALSVLAWRHRPARPLMVTQFLALLPMTLAMLAAVAVTQRYTGDFVPGLVLFGAWGMAAAERLGRRWRVVVGTLLFIATAWSVMLQALFALHYQGVVVWGIPPEGRERYQALQRWCDG